MKVSDFVNNGNIDILKLESLIEENAKLKESFAYSVGHKIQFLRGNVVEEHKVVFFSNDEKKIIELTDYLQSIKEKFENDEKTIENFQQAFFSADKWKQEYIRFTDELKLSFWSFLFKKLLKKYKL